MMPVPILHALRGVLVGTCRARIALQLEIVAPRRQVSLYRRSIRRLRRRRWDHGGISATPVFGISLRATSDTISPGAPIYPSRRMRRTGRPR